MRLPVTNSDGGEDCDDKRYHVVSFARTDRS